MINNIISSAGTGSAIPAIDYRTEIAGMQFAPSLRPACTFQIGRVYPPRGEIRASIIFPLYERGACGSGRRFSIFYQSLPAPASRRRLRSGDLLSRDLFGRMCFQPCFAAAGTLRCSAPIPLRREEGARRKRSHRGIG